MNHSMLIHNIELNNNHIIHKPIDNNIHDIKLQKYILI